MSETNHRPNGARTSLFRTGLILGIGVVGSLDEVVLHQLLQWHNFYVHTSQYWRIFTDGLFHLFSATMLFVGVLRLWAARGELASVADARPLVAGTLFGMGGFNLYDGIVQHKLLQLHPVREGVANQLPYDLAFNGAALALLVAGWVVWRAIRATESADRPVAGGRVAMRGARTRS